MPQVPSLIHPPFDLRIPPPSLGINMPLRPYSRRETECSLESAYSYNDGESEVAEVAKLARPA